MPDKSIVLVFMKRFFPLLLLFLFGCATPELPSVSPQVSLYPTALPMDFLRYLSPVELEKEYLVNALREANAYDPLVTAGISEDMLPLALRGLRSRGYVEIDCRRACQAKLCPFQYIILGYRKGMGLLEIVHYPVRPTKEQALGLSVEYLSEAKKGVMQGPSGKKNTFYHWERTEKGKIIAIDQKEHPSNDNEGVYHWDVIVTLLEEQK